MYLLDTLWVARYKCHVNQRTIQSTVTLTLSGPKHYLNRSRKKFLFLFLQGFLHYWPFQVGGYGVVYSKYHCSFPFWLFSTFCLICVWSTEKKLSFMLSVYVVLYFRICVCVRFGVLGRMRNLIVSILDYYLFI